LGLALVKMGETRMRKFVVAGLALAALAAPAAFADAHSEVVQAETHAGLAAKADTLDGVHQHLHHALNCVVGPKGTGYDAKEMNPCANAGNGAMPDTTDAAKKKSLQAAADELTAAIAMTDEAKAKAGATKAATMLKAAE
jgi:hypothetical protein